ncbi:MAG: hypothetical protein KME28_05005 [Pelatocladus maniniholoensis HA4357-MV3]|jgi:hypothetical protein|uniref:Uncharacterized protein n=1 Tax=Pelatocladus maniniholoensis HA4357-MV3 TaxID=1117104 RepID=A0A9E3LRI2_9NOST|nr:hypothetical protein [Pelatocladus maniniholoensis HA4357-MV3]BAZ68826.1 hypothetical protein NIES4106_35930 [Fischerella sp. NIES-4106]
MNKQINGLENLQTIPSQIELEFLEALLQPEDGTYPWNPGDEESEEYFHHLEEHFVLQDVLEEELTTRCEDFYNQLEALWTSHAPSYNHNTDSIIIGQLQESLQSRLSTDVPKQWLKAIAQKAADIFTTQQSMANQLVECVQAVLPGWGSDDLLVLARPYAYAMRSSESQKTAETVVNQVSEQEWTNLSEIEQARVSLAIAYYALQQLNSFQGEA